MDSSNFFLHIYDFMVPEVSLLSLLLEDEADDWTHQELVDHSTHQKE